jgi:hypothetical protein
MINASEFSDKRRLLHLFKTRLSVLKEDSEATVMIGMLNTSRATVDQIRNLSSFSLQ